MLGLGRNYFVAAAISFTIIQGEPERAPNTREIRSSVYIIIYLCVILNINLAPSNVHAYMPLECTKQVQRKDRRDVLL